MGNLLNLAHYRTGKSFVHFDRIELQKLMNIYSRQVASGTWRDYAIDQLDGMAMFSIYRSTHETPAFSVIKLASAHQKSGQYMALQSGVKIKQSPHLQAVLDAIEKRASKVVPFYQQH
ncbi:MAG: DUF2794 domain-containing protein [Pseudomonadota bacterium]